MTYNDFIVGISGLLGVMVGTAIMVLIADDLVEFRSFQLSVMIALGLAILFSMNRNDD